VLPTDHSSITSPLSATVIAERSFVLNSAAALTKWRISCASEQFEMTGEMKLLPKRLIPLRRGKRTSAQRDIYTNQ